MGCWSQTLSRQRLNYYRSWCSHIGLLYIKHVENRNFVMVDYNRFWQIGVIKKLIITTIPPIPLKPICFETSFLNSFCTKLGLSAGISIKSSSTKWAKVKQVRHIGAGCNQYKSQPKLLLWAHLLLFLFPSSTSFTVHMVVPGCGQWFFKPYLNMLHQFFIWYNAFWWEVD